MKNNNEYIPSLSGLLKFEITSILGRLIFNHKPKLNNGKNYLNLGCGYNIVQGFINADFFYSLKFWNNPKLKTDWMLDLRYKLNCDNEVFDGIFSEHTFEHLYPFQVKNLLKELHRVMKISACIRITLPDIDKYIKFYNGNFDDIEADEFKKRFSTGCSAIRNITQKYFHCSVWNYEEIASYLMEAGFREIKEMSFGQSRDENLLLDIEARKWETIYVEAIK
jgi:predicted SAM-dependent methyltransferase